MRYLEISIIFILLLLIFYLLYVCKENYVNLSGVHYSGLYPRGIYTDNRYWLANPNY